MVLNGRKGTNNPNRRNHHYVPLYKLVRNTPPPPFLLISNTKDNIFSRLLWRPHRGLKRNQLQCPKRGHQTKHTTLLRAGQEARMATSTVQTGSPKRRERNKARLPIQYSQGCHDTLEEKQWLSSTMMVSAALVQWAFTWALTWRKSPLVTSIFSPKCMNL